MIQEGEWRAGRPHGFGKKYDDLGFQTYEGLFRAGIPVYENYLKPMKHYYHTKKIKYIGGQKQHFKHGFGSKFDENSNMIYSGGWKYNDYSGIGIEYSFSILHYVKNFCCGILNLCKFKKRKPNNIKDARLSAESVYSVSEVASNPDVNPSTSSNVKIKKQDE